MASSPRLFASINNSDFLVFINAEIMLALYWYLCWWGFHPEPRMFVCLSIGDFSVLGEGKKKYNNNNNKITSPSLSPSKKASDKKASDFFVGI